LLLIVLINMMLSCKNSGDKWSTDVYETSAVGNKMEKITDFVPVDKKVVVTINPEKKYQTITGIGGSFTESSAYLLNQLGKPNRNKILQAYFGDEGARYSLTRTHINSCDFSLSNYSYAATPV